MRGERSDYVRALQQIGLGEDATATARDRLAALKALLELGPNGTTSYFERPVDPELAAREEAIRKASYQRDLARRERELRIR